MYQQDMKWTGLEQRQQPPGATSATLGGKCHKPVCNQQYS